MTTIEGAMTRGPCIGTGVPGRVSLEPASAYEAVTRQMVIAMSEELKEIKARLNGLLFMVAGSVLLDVALRLGGG